MYFLTSKKDIFFVRMQLNSERYSKNIFRYMLRFLLEMRCPLKLFMNNFNDFKNEPGSVLLTVIFYFVEINKSLTPGWTNASSVFAKSLSPRIIALAYINDNIDILEYSNLHICQWKLIFMHDRLSSIVLEF